MNKVFLIGNLTRDPELTATATGISVCRFSIAVNRSYTDSNGERQTDFFNCTAWRGLAENIARYTKKASKVAVSGSIQMRNYEDNQGIKRTAVDIIAEDVEFLGARSNIENGDDLNARRDRIGNTLDSYENNRRHPKSEPVQTQLQVFDDDGENPFGNMRD